MPSWYIPWRRIIQWHDKGVRSFVFENYFAIFGWRSFRLRYNVITNRIAPKANWFHDDLITWKYCPHYQPVVWWIHGGHRCITIKRVSDADLWYFFVVSLNKLLKKYWTLMCRACPVWCLFEFRFMAVWLFRVCLCICIWMLIDLLLTIPWTNFAKRLSSYQSKMMLHT